MKVVLLALYDYGSLGVRAISSVLKKKGFDVSIVFFKELAINKITPPTKNEKKKLIKILQKLNPDIIGISLRSSYFQLASELTDLIRSKLDALIVWGGLHPTISPAECIKKADIVLRGEGEAAIVELLEKLSCNKKINRIKNLWVKTKTGVVKNEVRPLIQDLDTLPLPVYDDENEYYIEGSELCQGIPTKKYTYYVIMSSKGCPFNCTYCGNNSLKSFYRGKGNFIRRRSVNSVIKELVQAKKIFKDMRKVFFVDELFVSDMKWSKEFSRKYRKKVGLPFECSFFPTLVKEEIVVEMKKSGLRDVIMGIESGSERARSEIYHRYTPQDSILNAARIFSKYQLEVHYDLILDNPLEKEEDKRETLDLLLRLKRPFKLHLYSLCHFPKTELTELLLAKKIIKRNEVEDMKAKAFSQWRMQPGYQRTTEDQFWNSLISLTPRRIIPKALIRYFSKSRFLKKHPQVLSALARFFTLVAACFAGIKMLSRGELTIPMLKRSIKNIKSVT